ncbi:MAG: hypothetical protein HXY19_02525 [Thermoanaerobaculaceae bacterium]|jgi:drug/metabolite transporter superfamily protein YnfA|nr:hypothetical protein [Thermoanaerobaculaceae bacterium]
MRTLAIVLVVLAALAFVVGAYEAFGNALVLGKPPVTYWRGAVGLLLFAVALQLLDRGRA